MINLHTIRWKIETLRLAYLCHRSFRAARAFNLPGQHFYHLGRSIGWKLFMRGNTKSRAFLMCPVSSTRYFEFDFAMRALFSSSHPLTCLDVSSPFQFSFAYTRAFPEASVLIANPSASDTALTARVARELRWPGIRTSERGVEGFQEFPDASFDAIWSISVLEHIGKEHGEDTGALRVLWRLLRPGGRLVITVPTDKAFWEEYRPDDPYGVRTAAPDPRGYFFQRFYDETAVHDRLTANVGVQPSRIEWFGVRSPGHFHAYIERWRQKGMQEVVNDPLDIARNYQIFPSFAAMPGEGVCGLLYQKPTS